MLILTKQAWHCQSRLQRREKKKKKPYDSVKFRSSMNKTRLKKNFTKKVECLTANGLAFRM